MNNEKIIVEKHGRLIFGILLERTPTQVKLSRACYAKPIYRVGSAEPVYVNMGNLGNVEIASSEISQWIIPKDEQIRDLEVGS